MPADLKPTLSAKQIKTYVRDETRAALYDMGRYVQSRAAKYPKQNPKSTYRRTGTLGRSIAVGHVEQIPGGYKVEVGTNIPYALAVEQGTGVYGPKGQPITPKTAKALAWLATRSKMQKAGLSGGVLAASGIKLDKATGKMKSSRAHDSMMIFARQVKGFPGWHYMEKAVTGEPTKAYVQKRLNQLALRIASKLG